MPLRIRFQGGPRAGEVLEFGDEVELVRFGRDAARCEVVFPEDETRVSREHCALRRVLGQLRLVTNRQSEVLVEGRPGHDDQIVPSMSELRLGARGPRLVIELAGESGLLPTEGGAEPRAGLHTRAEELGRGLRRARIGAGTALGGALVAAVAGTVGWRAANARIDASAVLAGETMQRVEAVRNEALARVGEAEGAFRELLPRVEESVYIVLQDFGSGEDRLVARVGTAWSAGEGVLATNAHVAQIFDQVGHGSRLVARSTGDPPRDLAIERVTIHPGYAAFASEVAGRDVIDLSLGEHLKLIHACDVALLHVAAQDRAALAAPLPIAPLEALRALSAGAPLAFAGFPAEGIVRAGTDVAHPRATHQLGHLTSVSDFFMARAEPGEAQLVHFSMPAAGGASGSPVVDELGRVVAVLCGGNVAGALGGVRVDVGGITYGQRADLVAELLEGRAEAGLAAHRAHWERRVTEVVGSSFDGMAVYLQQLAELETGMSFEDVLAEELELTPARRSAAIDLEAPADGRYRLVAVAERSVDVDAEVLVDGVLAVRDVEPDFFPTLDVIARAGQRLRLEVSAPGADVGPATRVKVRVYLARF